MTNDSRLFKLQPSKGRATLYEGKMIHQFDHRFSEPRYSVEVKEAHGDSQGRKPDEGQRLSYQHYRLGFRKVARNTDERTMIATIIPPNFHAENIQSVITLDREEYYIIPDNVLLFLCGVLNSFVLDFLLRAQG